jgi:hypothetical protein
VLGLRGQASDTRGSTVKTATTPVPNDDLWPGRCCRWRCTPRGGYGYTIRIPVTVVAVHRTRATVRLATGEVRVVSRYRLVDAMPYEQGHRVAVEPPAEARRAMKERP